MCVCEGEGMCVCVGEGVGEEGVCGGRLCVCVYVCVRVCVGYTLCVGVL